MELLRKVLRVQCNIFPCQCFLMAQISFSSSMVSTLLILAVGKEITKHIHQVKTSFMYSLLEKLSLLELKGSVIALSLR